ALLQSNAELLADPAKPRIEPRFSPAEHVLNQKLEAAMASGVYRELGLTIGVLAGKLGVPEHRLRALINQRLGYRNFSAFLNEHRVAEAKALLASHEHVALPILTIAMDLGYGSLAPFNRAFRDAEGQAPSEFRRAAILPDVSARATDGIAP
ncbi:MAG: helix-turn-helix domain-containing protein, partial [Sphingomonas sp.]